MKRTYFLIFGIAIFLFFASVFIYAADPPVDIKSPLDDINFENIVGGIIDLLFTLSIIVVPLMVSVGGFLYVTAAGNLEQITRAKKIILVAAVGFLVILLSKGIKQLIESILVT